MKGMGLKRVIVRRRQNKRDFDRATGGETESQKERERETETVIKRHV